MVDNTCDTLLTKNSIIQLIYAGITRKNLLIIIFKCININT
jgi:hypothetical protein